MKDKISVIVPIYKVEAYLDRCIESIVNQTYRNLEIILVDDGSPDRCPEMCDAWAKRDERIKVIHKKNGGVSAARNSGLDRATGDFLAFVDPDDWLKPDAYEALEKAFGPRKSEVDYVSGGLVFAAFQGMREQNLTSKSRVLTRDESWRWAVNHPSVFTRLYKARCFQTLRFQTHLARGEDVFMALELVREGFKLKVIPGNYYYYRQFSGVTHGHGASQLKIIPFVEAVSKFLQKVNLETCSKSAQCHIFSVVLGEAYRYFYQIERKYKRQFYDELGAVLERTTFESLGLNARLSKIYRAFKLQNSWGFLRLFLSRKILFSLKIKPTEGRYSLRLLGWDLINWERQES